MSNGVTYILPIFHKPLALHFRNLYVNVFIFQVTSLQVFNILVNASVATVLEGTVASQILNVEPDVMVTAAKSVEAHGEMVYMELAIVKVAYLLEVLMWPAFNSVVIIYCMAVTLLGLAATTIGLRAQRSIVVCITSNY